MKLVFCVVVVAVIAAVVVVWLVMRITISLALCCCYFLTLSFRIELSQKCIKPNKFKKKNFKYKQKG